MPERQQRRGGEGGDKADSTLVERSRSPTFAVVMIMGWVLVTVLELVIGLSVWTSFALTLVETLAVPALSAVVAGLARREITQIEDRHRRGARAHWGRTWGVHGVVLALLAGCLVGQYQILYRVARDASLASALGPSYATYTVMACLLVVLGTLGSPRRLAAIVASVADHPARLMAGSFGLAALVGGLVLALPVSVNHVEDVSLLHALFNAMSAVCVTGLAVGNVAETYSAFGQVVLLILFQVGGLGIMSLSTFFAVLGGRRLQVGRTKAMAEMLDMVSFAALRNSLIGIVTLTFVAEALGALLLYVSFADHPGVAFTAAESPDGAAGPGSRLWAAVFHAVSAFCNAGFSNFRDGLYPFVGSHAVSGVIAALIALGGLGFPVSFELIGRFRELVRRRRRKRMSLHTRVVLITSLGLWLTGAVFFLALEHDASMQALRWPERITAALFQSVTCRTAGFSTVDFGAMGPAAWMIACSLMFIGASPGSTGGGTKTTTLAVLFSALRSELRREPRATLDRRALTPATIRRAIAVTLINVLVVGSVLFVLLVSESHDPARVAFEVVSAVSTTGLSTGITSDLSTIGMLAVTLGMFLGRIGPLTAALAVGDAPKKRRYHYVEERIAIG